MVGIQSFRGKLDAESNRWRHALRAAVEDEGVVVAEDTVCHMLTHPVHRFVDLAVVAEQIAEAEDGVGLCEVVGDRLECFIVGVKVTDDGYFHAQRREPGWNLRGNGRARSRTTA